MIKDFILYIVKEYIMLKNNKCFNKYFINIETFFNNKNKNKNKIQNENITYKNYNYIISNNYTIQQLKEIAKFNKIKTSGTKEELINNIYNYLRLSFYANKIQKIYRNHIIQLYNKYHGPALIYRKKCINETDFLTMELVKHIDYNQFYSYEDSDNYIYAFDIMSLYNLICKNKCNEKIYNPYNRKPFPCKINYEINMLIKYSKILNTRIETKFENNISHLPNKKKIELYAISLFQKMDELGNYTDITWFTSLSMINLFKFLTELNDIWNYRAQLTDNIKKEIYPFDNIFQDIHLNFFSYRDYNTLSNVVLNVINRFINFGINNEMQKLGASYVLAAFTLVNENAANSMPWLYYSVSYNNS